jgi:hypothetical protein
VHSIPLSELKRLDALARCSIFQFPCVTHARQPPPPHPLSRGGTGHIRRARLLDRAPDPQLPVVVFAPALGPATRRHDDARVEAPRSDGGDSGQA